MRPGLLRLRFQSSEKLKETTCSDNLLRPQSTRSKDELMSVGGCVSQRPKNTARLRATARNNECYIWRPHHRSRSRSLVSNMASTTEKNGGGSLLGPTVERGIGPTKPDASFKARSAKAQFGATSLGPPAGLVHETGAGSSNGGPTTPLSSKLQCLGSFAKEVPSIDHSQELSKLKGLSISARRKARSWPPSLKVSPFAPKRNLDRGGSTEANLAIFWGRPVSNKGVLPPVQKPFKFSPARQREVMGFRVAVWQTRCVLLSQVPLSRAILWLGLLLQNLFPSLLFLLFICFGVSLFFVYDGVSSSFSGCSIFGSSWW